MAEPGTLCAWRALVLQPSAAFRRVSNLTPPKPLPAWPWHKPRTWLAQNSNVAENGPGSCLHGATDAAQPQLTSDPSLTVLAALCLLPSHSLVSTLHLCWKASTKSLQLFASLIVPLFTLSLQHAQS